MTALIFNIYYCYLFWLEACDRDRKLLKDRNQTIEDDMGKFVNAKKKRDREEEVVATTSSTKPQNKNVMQQKRKKNLTAEESTSEDDHGSNDEVEDLNDENSEGSVEEGGGDGLANTMAALLKQTTSSKVSWVLKV